MNRSQVMTITILCSSIAVAGCDNDSSAIQDLGTLGGDFTVGLGINSAGNVTGGSYLTADRHTGYHAFRYIDGLGIIDLGALPRGDLSEGRTINDSGQVGGGSYVEGFVPHAFLATATATLVDLGTLGGEFSHALGINNKVEVTGAASTGAGQTHAFLWTSEGGMEDLGTLGGNRSEGRSINEKGQVAGESRTPNDTLVHAFRYTEGVGLVDLGTLTGGRNSSAYGINDLGQVVGESETQPVFQGIFFAPIIDLGGVHAFLWTEGAAMVDLGHLGGGVSRANAINKSGAVVGYSLDVNGSYRAFRWTAEEAMIDLNTLIPADTGWVLEIAWDINDRGQIAGQGLLNGSVRGFRFDPPDMEAEAP